MNDETRYSDLKELRLTAALAREAALREELAAMKYDCQVNNSVINAQKADLKAAEQRIADLEKNQKSIQALARRTLWIAFCWNDHNFEAAHIEARKEAEKIGISSFEGANTFIGAMPEINPTEPGGKQ